MKYILLVIGYVLVFIISFLCRLIWHFSIDISEVIKDTKFIMSTDNSNSDSY